MIVYRTALILVLPKFNIEGIEGIEGICICADDATDYGGQTGSETSSEKPATSSEKGSEKGSEKTATSSEKILELIKQKPTLSAAEIAMLINMSSRGVEKHIRKLREAGVLKRIGADKGGYWEIKRDCGQLSVLPPAGAERIL